MVLNDLYCKGWKTVKVAWLDSINAMEECDEYYREVVIASIIVSSFTVIISVPVIINLIVILIHRCIYGTFSQTVEFRLDRF